MLVDGGYTGQPFADGVKERLEATVQVVMRNELQTFAVLPRRWVVERTHSWFNRYRRILIRWEKKPRNYLALLHFTSAIIAFRVAGVLG